MTTDKQFGDFDMRIKPLCCDNFFNLALRLRQVTGHAKTRANLAALSVVHIGDRLWPSVLKTRLQL
jgi:hypothetical protein